MRPLTLYIMESDNQVYNVPRLVSSFGDVVETIIRVPDRNLAEAVKGCETEWYGYMYSNEFLSEEYVEALPIMLGNNGFDIEAWVLFEKRGEEGKETYGMSPRLFKRNIELQGMLPLVSSKERLQRSLDGFVVGVI